MYRVDGVSGLNVFTGIKNHLPMSQPGAVDHQSCARKGRQLSACRNCCPFECSPERSAEYTNELFGRNRIFTRGAKHLLRAKSTKEKPVKKAQSATIAWRRLPRICSH